MMSRKQIKLYIFKIVLKWVAIFFGGLSLLALVIDSIEQTRRAISRQSIDFMTEFALTTLNVPFFAEMLLPFAVLFGTLFAFLRLNRHSEIIILKSAGLSAWQLILPALYAAFFIGLIKIFALNPLAISCKKAHEKLVQEYVKGVDISGPSNSFWLASSSDDSIEIVHALQNYYNPLRLVVSYYFKLSQDFNLIERIDASSGELQDKTWHFQNAKLFIPEESDELTIHPELIRKTIFNSKNVQQAFSSPTSLPIWKLFGSIKELESLNIPAIQHKIQLHVLLATPFLFMGLIMIIALFCFKPPRTMNYFTNIIGAVGSGFVFYILLHVLSTMGRNESLPLLLSTWSPAVLALLIGAAFLFHIEDG
jgi:lipopolysaccharide export system permease protein